MAFFNSLLSNTLYKIGSTIIVKIVAVNNPPITTVAKGRCTSAPADEEIAIGDTPLADTFYGGGNIYKTVGDDLYFKGMVRYHNYIYKLDSSNKLSKVFDYDGALSCFDVDEKNVVFIGSKANECNAIYKVEKAKAISCHILNEELLKDKYIAKVEYIPFTNSDGQEIDGWVLKPKDYDPRGCKEW